MKIYKYVVVPVETMEVTEHLIMPIVAQPLSVGWQDRVGVVLWASVLGDELHRTREYEFKFVPTGGPTFSAIGLPFVGTVQMPGGVVGHLFCEGAE